MNYKWYKGISYQKMLLWNEEKIGKYQKHKEHWNKHYVQFKISESEFIGKNLSQLHNLELIY